MQARSALFDLFGDHVSRRGGWAPVSGIVEAMTSLDVSPPATRTAISRMVREDWLVPIIREGVRGYAATAQAKRHLREAHERIYRVEPPEWDGSWDLVTIHHDGGRASRVRLGKALHYLGYAPFTPTVWLSPRRSTGLAEAVAAEGGTWDGFTARYPDDAELAARLWDLDELAERYREYLDWLEVGKLRFLKGVNDREAFVMRTEVVHRRRLFLFLDPGLPPAVLPSDWPGHKAYRRFANAAGQLLWMTDRYLDGCLGTRVGRVTPSDSLPATHVSLPRS